jgi:uracil-DNA glycosylase family 4
MNRRRLAYELHRYINAQRGMEPPEEPADVAVETQPPSHSESPDESTVSRRDEPDEKSDEDPLNTPEARQEKLDSLEQEAGGCVKCDLSENRNTVVFGEGTVRARVMVIGEGPGAREDEQGYPFVGPAGELLRGGFEKVGLDEDGIYITNTVKCRPPGNRDPEPEELDACRPYLDRQLELIDPPVILTLGNFALQYCLGDDRRISRSRGEVYDWQSRKLVPTYHPAYILRNRNDADKFFSDLKQVALQLRD